MFKVGHELARTLAPRQGWKGGGQVVFVKVGGVHPTQPGGTGGENVVAVGRAGVHPDVMAGAHQAGGHGQHRGKVSGKRHDCHHDTHGTAPKARAG
ncbi:hypothetical protein CVV67_17900 [Arthrobacter stackebrandtii]|nr:hypothetical protein CVV67_17900 [Arthrobacter stackebrandtii]